MQTELDNIVNEDNGDWRIVIRNLGRVLVIFTVLCAISVMANA